MGRKYALWGVVVGLIGTWVAAKIPNDEIARLAAGWGGGSDEEWRTLTSTRDLLTWISYLLLIISGTLQILGTLPDKGNRVKNSAE